MAIAFHQSFRNLNLRRQNLGVILMFYGCIEDIHRNSHIICICRSVRGNSHRNNVPPRIVPDSQKTAAQTFEIQVAVEGVAIDLTRRYCGVSELPYKTFPHWLNPLQSFVVQGGQKSVGDRPLEPPPDYGLLPNSRDNHILYRPVLT